MKKNLVWLIFIYQTGLSVRKVLFLYDAPHNIITLRRKDSPNNVVINMHYYFYNLSPSTFTGKVKKIIDVIRLEIRLGMCPNKSCPHI